MRVLQVTDNYAPATGGLERAVSALAQGLATAGHEVDVVTMSRPDAPPTEPEGPVTVRRVAGWTRHLRRFSTDSGHRFHPTVPDPQLTRRLQELVDERRPDVVHAHGWILHSCLGLRLPRGSALVTTLHDYGLTCPKKTMIHRDRLDSPCAGPALGKCLRCTSGFYGPVKGPALTLGLAASGFDRVAMFLPISAAVAQACLPGVEPERITVVPSFVDDDLARDAVRPEFLPDGDFVLFVGALGEHKGAGLVAMAHRQMATDAPLVMLGSRRADTPDLGERAIVRSGVPHRLIMGAYAAASVVAVPSRWAEPQGLVAIEAMTAGAPVVASAVGGLAELVEPGVSGVLVPPGDAAALARALDGLLADPGRRARMGQAGRARAAAFTASAGVPRVVAAYERARSLAVA